MCNDYEQHIVWAEYCRMMQSLALDIPIHQTELDLPLADDIRINDLAPIMRAAGNTIELARMNFAFPPSGPKGGPSARPVHAFRIRVNAVGVTPSPSTIDREWRFQGTQPDGPQKACCPSTLLLGKVAHG